VLFLLWHHDEQKGTSFKFIECKNEWWICVKFPAMCALESLCILYQCNYSSSTAQINIVINLNMYVHIQIIIWTFNIRLCYTLKISPPLCDSPVPLPAIPGLFISHECLSVSYRNVITFSHPYMKFKKCFSEANKQSSVPTMPISIVS
jgi:hypothetical protein